MTALDLKLCQLHCAIVRRNLVQILESAAGERRIPQHVERVLAELVELEREIDKRARAAGL